jgi:hypothetical protein
LLGTEKLNDPELRRDVRHNLGAVLNGRGAQHKGRAGFHLPYSDCCCSIALSRVLSYLAEALVSTVDASEPAIEEEESTIIAAGNASV